MEAAYGRDEPTGLLVLPHFAGAATPYMDTGSKGAILGLTTATTAAEIYRACMEGVAYEMRLNYEALSDSGIHFARLNATGGGAKSRVWMQMKADILNLPITALKTADAGTVGSAMLTGIAVGLFRDLDDAADRMVQEMETYAPRAEMHEKYMKIYERYRAVYSAVRPLM
jgi:xylulokinase